MASASLAACQAKASHPLLRRLWAVVLLQSPEPKALIKRKPDPRLLHVVSIEISCKVVRLDLERDSWALTIDVCSSPESPILRNYSKEYDRIQLKIEPPRS